MQSHSSHPIGKAILSFTNKFSNGSSIPLPTVSDIESHIGLGIKGKIDGHSILLGNSKFIQSEDINKSNWKDIQMICDRLAEEGKSNVLVAVDGEVVGIFGIMDTIREDAEQVIQSIQQLGR